MIKWNWKIFFFFLTEIFHVCKKINIPSTFLLYPVVFCLRNSQPCHPKWAQHLMWTMHWSRWTGTILRFHSLRSAFGTDVMGLFGWAFHSAITHMADKTCCQSWWAIRELLVEFDSLYFGCFLFQTCPSHCSSFQQHAVSRSPWRASTMKAKQAGPPKPLHSWVRAAESKDAARACPLWGLLKEQYGSFVARTGTAITSGIL